MTPAAQLPAATIQIFRDTLATTRERIKEATDALRSDKDSEYNHLFVVRQFRGKMCIRFQYIRNGVYAEPCFANALTCTKFADPRVARSVAESTRNGYGEIADVVTLRTAVYDHLDNLRELEAQLVLEIGE